MQSIQTEQTIALNNARWGCVIMGTLMKMGVQQAVISPGSRSTPLILGLEAFGEIEKTISLDERSAAFFALGKAQATGKPVALICTSGSAGAHFLPALIEAKHSHIPLIVLTADRPPEAQDCHERQTIDQSQLYAKTCLFSRTLPLPEADMQQLKALRDHVRDAWERSLSPIPGPIHLNSPFREPFFPIEASAHAHSADASSFTSSAKQDPKTEIAGLREIKESVMPLISATGEVYRTEPDAMPLLGPNVLSTLTQSEKGLLIAGPHKPQDAEAFARSVNALGQALGWPILAEGLSPLRMYPCELTISHYEWILEKTPTHRGASAEQSSSEYASQALDQAAQSLLPDCVLCIGPPPIGKALRRFMDQSDANTILLHPYTLNTDPLHRGAQVIRSTPAGLLRAIELSKAKHLGQLSQQSEPFSKKSTDSLTNSPDSGTFSSETPVSSNAANEFSSGKGPSNGVEPNSSPDPSLLNQGTSMKAASTFAQAWIEAQKRASRVVNDLLCHDHSFFEGKVPWLLSEYLPESTPLFVANSKPVRDVGLFWQAGGSKVRLFFNRGADGIDGNIATALGLIEPDEAGVLVIGDLAFFHDASALLLATQLKGYLTILVLNNGGGGIFRTLPIAGAPQAFFQKYFLTPQSASIELLAMAYGGSYYAPQSEDALGALLDSLKQERLRIVEWAVDNDADERIRGQILNRIHPKSNSI